MSMPRLFIKAGAPIASIFLILAGILQLRAQFWIVGGVCILLAMLGFILSMRWLEKAPFTVQETDMLRPWLAPAILWTVVVSLLGISVLYVADNFKSTQTDRAAAAAWVASVVLGFLIIWGKRFAQKSHSTIQEKIRANRMELILLGIVLILATALRTIDLTTHPYPWSGDEASIGIEGTRILNGEITNFFDTSWSSQPNWSFLPTAIMEMIFGKTILAVRLTSVIAGILAVLFVYLAARELFNRTIALMAAVFLATLPYNVHFSRIGVNNVIDSMMSALIFWLIARALNTDAPRYYYSAGVAGGLCLYTYAGTRLALILGGIAILFLIIRQRGYLNSHWKHLSAFSVGIIVSAAPQAAFFARHPDIFIGRMGQEGILFNGWLTQQAALGEKSVWEILANQFTRTIMVFIASSAPGNFFNSPNPYLTVLGSILFLLGMAYALAFLLEPRHFMILIWFWAVILFGGILTMNPPANTRLLMTTPAIAILMALGAYKVLEYVQRFRMIPERAVVPLLAVIAAMIAYQNINFYMGEYKNKMYFEDANGEYAMEVSLMANSLGKDSQIFVLGAPRVYSGFPTFPFVAPSHPRMDLNADSLPTLQLPPNTTVGFFAVPENHQLLQEVSQIYPGGESGHVYRKTKPNEVLFEYYILKP